MCQCTNTKKIGFFWSNDSFTLVKRLIINVEKMGLAAKMSDDKGIDMQKKTWYIFKIHTFWREKSRFSLNQNARIRLPVGAHV
jgi:hypothetical protein